MQICALLALLLLVRSGLANVHYLIAERHEKVTAPIFAGEVIRIREQLFGGIRENATLLLYGGVLVRRTERDAGREENLVLPFARSFLARHHGQQTHFELSLDKVYYYDALMCIDFGRSGEERRPYEYEVGVYNRHRKLFESKHWREFVLGVVVAMSVTTSADSGVVTQHQILLHIDTRLRTSIAMHTFQVQRALVLPPPPPEAASPPEGTLRIMTYNIWNTNPPLYSMNNASLRAKKYSDRLDYLCQLIAAEDSDVVLLQEVRLENSLLSKDAGSNGGSSHDAGSQLELLLARLQAVEQQWHFIFAPAMSMVDKGSPGKRLEEGLAILSKLPLEGIEVMLLPRRLLDNKDDHSRAILRAVATTKLGNKVELLTSHFSLSASSREDAVDFLRSHAVRSDQVAPFQVFAGDLI